MVFLSTAGIENEKGTSVKIRDCTRSCNLAQLGEASEPLRNREGASTEEVRRPANAQKVSRLSGIKARCVRLFRPGNPLYPKTAYALCSVQFYTRHCVQ